MKNYFKTVGFEAIRKFINSNKELASLFTEVNREQNVHNNKFGVYTSYLVTFEHEVEDSVIRLDVLATPVEGVMASVYLVEDDEDISFTNGKVFADFTLEMNASEFISSIRKEVDRLVNLVYLTLEEEEDDEEDEYEDDDYSSIYSGGYGFVSMHHRKGAIKNNFKNRRGDK